MILGVLKEKKGETRVSLVPEVVKQFSQMGVTVWVEAEAGQFSLVSDQEYEEAGAVIQSAVAILQQAQIILQIHPFTDAQIGQIPPRTVLVGIYQPLWHPLQMQQWADRQYTVFSLDSIPRTTRAQSMDVLSSQANIAGYKAILLAAYRYARYFPMLMTAAGSIAPARVMVLGAGVAGLQAIATARRLGAVVEVFDTRPAVKEEVMSLGAKFIEVEGAADSSQAGGYAVEQSEEFQRKQKDRIAESIAKADIVVTTAQIPGKKAPVLITKEMMNRMKRGAVIIDIAAATGGNTELTVNDQTVQYNGVTVIGDANLPAAMPADASKLYARNVMNFLKLIIDKNGQLQLNFEDDIVKGTCIAHDGLVVNKPLKELLK